MRKVDPLQEGEKETWSIYGTKALRLELERQATLDGYKKLAPYMADLLIEAVRRREAERKKQK